MLVRKTCKNCKYYNTYICDPRICMEEIPNYKGLYLKEMFVSRKKIRFPKLNSYYWVLENNIKKFYIKKLGGKNVGN